MGRISLYRNKFVIPYDLIETIDMTDVFPFVASEWESGYAVYNTHAVVGALKPLSVHMDSKARNMLYKLEYELDYYKRLKVKFKSILLMDIDWMKKPPYEHQEDAILKLMGVERAAVFADMGLGKTYMMLGLIAGLKERGESHKTLVVCPKVLIEDAWLPSIPEFTNLTGVNLRKKSSWKKDADIYILNYESVPGKLSELKKMKFDLIVLDESSKIKSPTSKRTEAVLDLREGIERRYLLSGSPAPNGVLDLWSQFLFLDDGVTLGRDFYYFRQKTHNAIDLGNGIKIWKPKHGVPDMVAKRIEPITLRYDKKLLKDLPDRVFIDVPVTLSPEQKKAYKELEEEFITYVDSEEVVIKTALVKANKLLQVTGGALMDENGVVHKFKNNAKLEVLRELLEEVDDQVLIWAHYRHEIEDIAEAIGGVYIHGGVSSNQRTKHLKDFREGKVKYLVANAGTIGHGVTLVNTHYAIYYSYDFNWELMAQSRDRIYRIGQKETCFYYNLVAKDTIDKGVLGALNNKKSIEDVVLSLGEAGT